MITASLLHSFRFRLTLWFVAILAVILAGFSLFIFLRQVQVLRTETETRLTAQATQFATILRTPIRRPPEEEHEEEFPGFTEENLFFMNEHLLFAILNPDGTVTQKSEHFPMDALPTLTAAWAKNPTRPIEYTLAEEDEPYETQRVLFLFMPIELEHDLHAQLVLGSPIDQSHQLPRLAVALVAVFGLTLVIAFGGGYWLADQAMRPVQTITRTARDLGEHDLNRRLNLHRPDELGELAATFDSMLARLQAAFARQRQFTADASHELRTPLTIIELETNRALERPRTPKEYEKTLHTIQAENEWMSRLVNELLTLARMDSGRAKLQLEHLDLSDLAVDVVERLTTLAEKHGVQLSTGALEESVVNADRDYLTHLLTNLIENGIKYATGSAPRVVVETGTDLPHAWVRVTDNGPGIPPEHLPHLFDRFYRIDESRTRDDDDAEAPSGSGLGLAIVQSIAHAFGGKVEVQSEVGKGTVFTVWFPGGQARG
ncbi:MAG: HAMP domain-containing protein [Anaerolineales bacterium]|nr:HAMP domain-containing protein [Anaerolineales bacterium]